MLEAKFPPPRPAVAAATRNIEYGVPGLLTQATSSPIGSSRSRTLTTVQLRPPKRGTAKV